ncbi:hypothetical protein KY332_02910 [Candidatus Woesearchaeota archaeon]|nr:hypothetical protein [Candidatus Woesearchaeota archaeon]
MKKLVLLLIFVFIGTVYAQPQFPIQIYGDITPAISDGSEIRFEVDGLEVGSGEIMDNKYGDPPLFIEVDDTATIEKEGYADGDVVDVYIEDVKVDEITLEGNLVEKDITISGDDFDEVQKETTTADTRRGSVGTSIACDPSWECSDWEECINGKQTRTCIDKWECGTDDGKPAEIQTCIEPAAAEPKIIPSIEEPLVIEEKGRAWIYIIITIIVLGLAGGLGFVIYERERAHKSLQQEKQQPKLEDQSFIRLQSYVKQTLDQGYTREQIRAVLLREGWSQSVINKALK